MNKFEKVSYEEYCRAVGGNEDLHAEYANIKLPKRATKRSSGYDIYSPVTFDLAPGKSIKFPTGIKVHIDDDKYLAIHVRSSVGFKWGVVLSNGTGIIDSDYCDNPSNEGHIFIKLVNHSTEGKVFHCDKGDAIAQGIFSPYAITVDDDADGERVGGIGSTGR